MAGTTPKPHHPRHRKRPLSWALAALACLASIPAAQGAGVADRVYVSNEKDHRLQVFNTRGDGLGEIAVCQRPRHMMFLPGHAQIIVSCGDSDQLGIVDVAAGKLVATVPVGESPEIFDLSPDGRTVYVSIEDDNVLAAYDIASKKPLFQVQTGKEPEGVLVTADGKFAYVTSEAADAVYLIDLGQKKIAKTIKTGKRPRRLIMLAGANELWVTNELEASVAVVDTKSGQVKQKIAFTVEGVPTTDITPVGMAASPDGASVWVGLGRANRVAQVNAANKTVTHQVPVGRRAWGLAMHPDGKTLYVANGLSDELTLIDTATAKPLRTVVTGRTPSSVLVEP
ncbi:MAG: beta-propeller fold lactonase family protein [Proteobacteria bacterium]|nr:beta-propeller fold lactonase family protein [Pseudomonadota bacterium]